MNLSLFCVSLSLLKHVLNNVIFLVVHKAINMEFNENEASCLTLSDLTKAENDVKAVSYIDCHKC